MADGIRVLTRLEDPIGEVTGMKKRERILLPNLTPQTVNVLHIRLVI